MSIDISVIIPTYNEEENVENLIKELIKFSNRHKDHIEIILVNNGSIDKTGHILDKYKMRYMLKIFHANTPTLGKGNGIKIGIENAKGDYIAMMDGDMQQNPEDIFILIKLMEKKGLDYILGWRRNRKDSKIRLLLSFTYNFIIKMLFNLPVWDIGGQPRVFKGKYLKDINIFCKKWLIELEIPYKLKQMGLIGGFGRVSHRIRSGGTSKINISQAFSILKDLIKFRLGAYSNV